MSRDPENTIFGTCSVCGADGGDDSSASGADASARDTTGNGVPLQEHNGKMMCELCVKKSQADDESREVARRCTEEQRFRDQAGFVRTVADE